MGFESEISGSLGGETELLNGPCLARRRILPNGLRSESIESLIVGRMNRDQLSLQVSRKLCQGDIVRRECAEDFLAISKALRGALYIEQASVPRGDLHAFVAEV